MEKLLNLHNNNLQIKNDKYTFYKLLMEVQKESTQQQGQAQAKYRLEEVKKKFVNLLMRNGEKSKAHKLFTQSLNLLEKKSTPITPSQYNTSYTSVTSSEVMSAMPLVTLSKDLTKQSSVFTEKKPINGKKHSILCDNKAELFQFYTVYNTVEKTDIFEKNEKYRDDTFLTSQTSNTFLKKCNDVRDVRNVRNLRNDRNITNTDRKNKSENEKKSLEHTLYTENISNTENIPSGTNRRFDMQSQVTNLQFDGKQRHGCKESIYYYNDFLKKNILYQAIENVKPPLELRKVRKGGTTYQVPAIVSQKRQERLAIKWIIESAKKKNKKSNSFSESLVTEILEAFNKTGRVRQKRDEILKIAEFNRAYTRYRWW